MSASDADAPSAPSDWDYRGLAAESYDLWFGGEPFDDQAGYETRIRARGGAALEIASGTGRLLLPYLRDGLDVEGVDASEEMLAICRAKARGMALAPVLHRQRMQELALQRRYTTLYVPYCSFQILARREEAFTALERFRDHLEPDGQLLLSLHVPWQDFAHERVWRLRRSGERPSDGATVQIHECTWSDRFEQVLHIVNRLELYRDGRLVHGEIRPHLLRWYHPHEFALMLERVGFRDVRAEAIHRARPARDGDAEWLAVARR